jgi:hypothetical protein
VQLLHFKEEEKEGHFLKENGFEKREQASVVQESRDYFKLITNASIRKMNAGGPFRPSKGTPAFFLYKVHHRMNQENIHRMLSIKSSFAEVNTQSESH